MVKPCPQEKGDKMNLETKNGYEFQVDPEDEALARESGWYGVPHTKFLVNGDISPKIRIYIQRGFYEDGKKRKTEYLHRMITKAPKGAECDHINGDCTDNRKSNLRVCSRSNNAANGIRYSNNKSGFRGVSWYKRGKCWESKIKVNYKTIYLGRFHTKEEAADTYNIAAVKYFGEFARLNDIPPLVSLSGAWL
jgi:hypothetical protein